MKRLLQLIFTSFICINANASNSWTVQEILKLKSITNVQISPDQSCALFSVVEADMSEKNQYVFSTYQAKLDGSLDSAVFLPNSQFARWSPNGKWVAFVSNLDGVRQLHIVSKNGERPIQLTFGKASVQSLRWSPNGKQIAFVMAESGVNRLWILDVFSENPIPTPITSNSYYVIGSGDFGYTHEEFDFSPDGKAIIFSYATSNDLDELHTNRSLATVNLQTLEITAWQKQASFEALPRFSPDGKHVAYLTSEGQGTYLNGRYAAVRLADGTGFKRLAKTENEGPNLTGRYLLEWTKDGRNILFFEPKGTLNHLVLLPIDGNPGRELYSGPLLLRNPVLSIDRSSMGFIGEALDQPQEAYFAKVDDFKPSQISNLNQGFLEYPKIRAEVIEWSSSDGQRVEGILNYPVNYAEGNSYPLIVEVHGGPMSHFMQTFVGTPFIYPHAVFAQEGFLVLKVNYRGSCGYGLSFRSATVNDWGRKDFEDVMSGVTALINRGIVDTDRLGIMGWSYGGYLSAWTISQTNCFKAASLGAGLMNLTSEAGTTDIQHYLPDYLGFAWENPEIYQNRSPLFHVQKVTTPCLLQHGLLDKRVPVSQSYEFYNALKHLGKKAELDLYPETYHYPDKPLLLQDGAIRNLEWFKEHLKI